MSVKGKPLSEKHKNKISETKRRQWAEKNKQKMSAGLTEEQEDNLHGRILWDKNPVADAYKRGVFAGFVYFTLIIFIFALILRFV